MPRLPVVAAVTLLALSEIAAGRETGPDRIEGSDGLTGQASQTRVEGWPQWRGSNRDGAAFVCDSLDLA